MTSRSPCSPAPAKGMPSVFDRMGARASKGGDFTLQPALDELTNRGFSAGGKLSAAPGSGYPLRSKTEIIPFGSTRNQLLLYRVGVRAGRCYLLVLLVLTSRCNDQPEPLLA